MIHLGDKVRIKNHRRIVCYPIGSVEKGREISQGWRSVGIHEPRASSYGSWRRFGGENWNSVEVGNLLEGRRFGGVIRAAEEGIAVE